MQDHCYENIYISPKTNNLATFHNSGCPCFEERKISDTISYNNRTMQTMERGSSVVECRTRNQVSPGSNPSLLPFGRLGIFVLSIDAPVHPAV